LNLRTRIGGDGPVVATSDASGWQLIVRGQTHATGIDSDDLHVALRKLAIDDRELAPDAFGVIINCLGAWEDEYTEEHGEAALPFEDWMEGIEHRGVTWVAEHREPGMRLPAGAVWLSETDSGIEVFGLPGPNHDRGVGKIRAVEDWISTPVSDAAEYLDRDLPRYLDIDRAPGEQQDHKQDRGRC